MKLVIISVSLVSIIVPYFKTIYSLDVLHNSSDSGLEQMVLKAQFKPDENQFLAKDGYYQVQKFNFVASNDSEICPLNNCKYGVQNTQFSPNSVSGGYVFEGRLTVTTIEDGVKKSEFYYFNVGFDKTSEKEINGTNIQILEAPFGLGMFSFIPGIDYNIINATLLVDKESPLLTIYGESPPLSIIKFFINDASIYSNY
ncbi:MAG: hypothetical protein WBL54_07665 [Nitrososphaeraceae archaeon]